jgi:Na+-transporting NADH:ubiquinone oxidoreductase subunit F
MSSAAPASHPQPLSLLNAKLIESRQLSATVRLLTFAVPDRPRLEFLPGQSIRIELPMEDKITLLTYSIASSPGPGNRFELCVKTGRKGSPPERLFELREGEPIRFCPPQGDFVLRDATEDTIFLAAGTGIAPIRSMIYSLMEKNGRHSAQLLFGTRDTESLFFHSEFVALSRQHPHFQYLPILSQPAESWKGACGHVQHHLAGVVSRPGHAYLCGPLAMVRSASAALSQLGWPEQRIHYDRDFC